MATELDLAYGHCQRIAKEHAKNFYYAFRTLPATERRAIYAAYAFCRLCDDIADGDLSVERKLHLFAEMRHRLRGSVDGPDQDLVFTSLHDTTRTFDIPLHYFQEIIEGVEMDMTWTRFQTFQELRPYCYKVASVVGLICIEVFGYEDPKSKEHAVDLGLAMQLINIIRDVREDAQRDRIYIPLEEMEFFGYSEDELMAGVNNNAFRELMKFQAARARAYLDSGKNIIALVSPRSRACPKVLHGVYSAILDRIEASGFDVFKRRIGLSTFEKMILTTKLWLGSLTPSVPPLIR